MSSSASKLYILYILAGGAEGRSCYGIEALKKATGLSAPTLYKARDELKQMGLIFVKKEMVRGYKNKKPKIWVELLDLPVNKLQLKQRRELAHNNIKNCRRGLRPRTKKVPYKSNWPDWMKQGAEKLRKQYEKR
ncbi:MAG: hypothetical protein ABIB11_04210 [Candidatus Omnitrophota bacterium]